MVSSKLYKSLTLAGTGYSATFNNGIATAEGTDYVLLQEGFEIGSNMEMLIQTEHCWTDMRLNRAIITKDIPRSPSLEQILMRRH